MGRLPKPPPRQVRSVQCHTCLVQQLPPPRRGAIRVPLLQRRARELGVRCADLAVQPRLPSPQAQQLLRTATITVEVTCCRNITALHWSGNVATAYQVPVYMQQWH